MRVRWKDSHNCLERTFEIHSLIRSGQCGTAEDLAKRFGVSRRTIERDIEFIRDRLSAPIRFDRQSKRYLYTGPFEFPTVTFSEGEMIVFYLGEKLLSQCMGTPYEPYIRTAMDKLRLMVTPEIEVSQQEIEQIVTFQVPLMRGDEKEVAENYECLFRAAQNHRVVQISYYAASKDEVTVRKVEPYHLTVRDGVCYLIGYCRLRNEMRIFALDRIKGISETGEEFMPDPSFNVSDYLGSSWGIEKGNPYDVVLQFDQYQARWIRDRRWNKGQEIRELPTGGIEFRVTVEGLNEIMRWVLQFGAHVKVIEPPELVSLIEQEVAKLNSIYGVR